MTIPQVFDIKHTDTRNSFGSDILAKSMSFLLPQLSLPRGSKSVCFVKNTEIFSLRNSLSFPLFIGIGRFFRNEKQVKNFSLPNTTANVAVTYFFPQSDTVTATDTDHLTPVGGRCQWQ